MLTNGSFGVDVIEKYNSLYPHLTTLKTPYLVPADPFSFQSFNRNIHMEHELVGFITLILVHGELSHAQLDWFDIACDFILSWFSLYANQNELFIKQSFFEELLERNFENIDRFSLALNTIGWNKYATKRLILLSCLSNHLNMNLHISKIISQKTSSLYAINYENTIVVLLNEDNLSYPKALELILPIIQSCGYYGGSSNSFTKLTDLPDFYSLAKIALQHGAAVPGVIHACHDHILPYIFQILKENAKLDLCHPALLLLREYDAQNKTEYCKVLYCYLQNECNQTKTAEKLNFHRNTLIRKITLIEEISHLDLTDYETRFHLLISFEYEKQKNLE
jgi:sugar diacid utilization regulator